ncbi:UDP-glucose 4-epimerase GalE [Salinarimonas ramus]|uniref:UDP-glucose 4-epimerase n=1 Tax=Salinarimonas ramus TaxID=690164 RepID=A0A917QA13_9HYPH|nr:UDP-glucose 4-epimerase GalE [Salinarimonas ramus]GGK38240.1 UDP-glucose 4-epimerase GalE [Salinarimonas ramus]
MPVLVTGGAGYIGAHAALALVESGERVIVLDDLSTGLRESVPSQAQLVVGDVADQDLVGRLVAEHGIEEILHFAAKIEVPASVANPLYYYEANTLKTRALLEAAVRAGVRRIVFSSTAAVYGEPSQPMMSEDAAPDPINPYGRSKLMSEWMIEDAARAHGLDYVILRYFNVAGADPKGRIGQCTPNATHLVKVACQTALGRRPALDVFGEDYPTPDGTCIRDYIHVSDLADAHLRALEHLRGGGESLVLNCGYGRGASVREVIESVKRASGVDFAVRAAPRRAGDPAALIADATRLRETFAWSPRFADLDAIVSQALAWEARLPDEREKASRAAAG